MRNKILAGIGILVGLIVIGNLFSGKSQIKSEKIEASPSPVITSSPVPTSEPERSFPPESLVTPEQLKSSQPTVKPTIAPTVQPVQQTTKSNIQPAYTGGDKDCDDFSTHAEAQAFFEAAGPGDPHRLDRDGDGIACETLP